MQDVNLRTFQHIHVSVLFCQIVYPSIDVETDQVHYILTTVLVVFTFIPGSTIDDIGVVLDYKGAILGGLIGFGYGAMIFLSLVRNQAGSSDSYMSLEVSGSLRTVGGSRTYLWKLAAFAFLLWALVSGVLGCTITTLNLLK